ncbi:hypothetical protein acdb102_06340 [Acidothermaceae bacterium B102]|nr:hypothetical protein acdb102_06340 [Acidothermaceae bacterium B102]
MGLGRRSAPSAPPIPVPPLPPSAYGISVPGAPVAPQQQYAPPPTAPPAAPPQAAPPAPSPFADYAAQPFAAAPVSTFGGAPASTFGGSAASTFGGPPAAYGSPVWSPAGGAPAGKSKRTMVLGVVIGLVAVLAAVAIVPRALDELHRHHTTTLPASLATYSKESGTAATAADAAMNTALPAKFQGKVTQLQVGLYSAGAGLTMVVVTADVPAGTQRHADEAFRNDDGTTDFHAVAAPSSFGGSVRCTVLPSPTGLQMPACGWMDDGTFGMVLVPGSDEAGTIALLTQVRPLLEH